MSDLISREHDAPDKNVDRINKFIDGLELIFSTIRDAVVDDTVCGLCEYSVEYLDRWDDWRNDCRGSYKNHCFKLSNEYRERWMRELLPASVEPELKKGKWIPKFNGKFTGGAYWFSCSKCSRIVPEVRNGGWNYCPNCGADMRGKDE